MAAAVALRGPLARPPQGDGMTLDNFMAGTHAAMTEWHRLRLPRGSLHNSQVSTMSPIALLLNLLWIVFGGLWMAVGWVFAAVIMAITIIGIPWARAAFNIASYT